MIEKKLQRIKEQAAYYGANEAPPLETRCVFSHLATLAQECLHIFAKVDAVRALAVDDKLCESRHPWDDHVRKDCARWIENPTNEVRTMWAESLYAVVDRLHSRIAKLEDRP